MNLGLNPKNCMGEPPTKEGHGWFENFRTIVGEIGSLKKVVQKQVSRPLHPLGSSCGGGAKHPSAVENH